MTINNTLEARMNINKIILMIHVNMIWNYIIFSQKSEKTEYKKKNIYSIIFIDKIEIRELKKLNSKYQMMNDITLNKFLMTKEYR